MKQKLGFANDCAHRGLSRSPLLSGIARFGQGGIPKCWDGDKFQARSSNPTDALA